VIPKSLRLIIAAEPGAVSRDGSFQVERKRPGYTFLLLVARTSIQSA
jgi:hypothetical protein